MEALQQAKQGSKERSILSVLAYCHFQMGDFQSAAGCYHDLTKICQEVTAYKHHLAQCLFKIGNMDEALEMCDRILGESTIDEEIRK